MTIANTPELDSLRALCIRDAALLWKTGAVEKLLSNFFEVAESDSGQFVEVIRHRAFDIALIRHGGQVEAPRIVPLLREIGSENLAIVVLAEMPSSALELQCLSAGASDFLDSEMDDERLLAWKICKAVEKERQSVEALQWSALQAKSRQEEANGCFHAIRAQRALLMNGQLSPNPPSWLVSRLADLLRAYLVATGDEFQSEVAEIVAGLSASQVTLTEALLAHSFATEKLLLSMGQRSCRRILDRSQLLGYALVVQFQHAESATLSPL